MSSLRQQHEKIKPDYTMHKINIVILLTGMLCFNSCKKDHQDADTISASIDGKVTTFNVGAHASTLNVTGGYGISIQGNKKNPSDSKTALSISIVSPDPIVKRTYVENSNGNPLVGMTYDFDLVFGIVYTFEGYGSNTHPVSVTITEINSSFVKGTFSGEVQGTDATGATAKYVITNGTFNVKF